MASTRPTSEQLRFTSSKTGEHSLDTYMENAEIGNTTLANLLSQAFDTSGQFKTGFAEYKGDFATSTLYDIGDVYRDAATEDLYTVRVQHTSSNIAADLSAAKIALVLDASAVNTFSTAAAASATAAAASSATATTKAAEATTAKTAAETAQAASETARNASQTAQAAAEAAFDNFSAVYLGAKSSDPTVDNDGNALTAGDLYFSSSENVLKVYSGSAWQAAALNSALVTSKTSATGSAVLPAGTTAQRDGSPSAGYLRFNTTTSSAEVFDGSSYTDVGGGGPALSGTTTGQESVIRTNANAIDGSLTIASNSNGMSAGPVTINSGASVTISANAVWHVIGT
ncbi:MAG: hypothetical protein P8R39_12250 [Alphaproteobacteria bacterium]|nr:hypothetical protein [Alphaproteobacteria bacterium]